MRIERSSSTIPPSRSQTFYLGGSERAFSSLIQMQKFGSPWVSFTRGGHDHSSRLSVTRPHSPTQSDRDRDQRPPAVSANHVFRSIIRSPAAMHCNRATFLSHDQGGALLCNLPPPPPKNCIVIWYSSINTRLFRIPCNSPPPPIRR